MKEQRFIRSEPKTSMPSDIETWTAVLRSGEHVAIEVRRRADAGHTVTWRCRCGRSERDAWASSSPPDAGVSWMASRVAAYHASPVVELLAPGQVSRAEIEAALAREREARVYAETRQQEEAEWGVNDWHLAIDATVRAHEAEALADLALTTGLEMLTDLRERCGYLMEGYDMFDDPQAQAKADVAALAAAVPRCERFPGSRYGAEGTGHAADPPPATWIWETDEMEEALCDACAQAERDAAMGPTAHLVQLPHAAALRRVARRSSLPRRSQ